MANKRIELVSRNSNEELDTTDCKEVVQTKKMCSCEDDVAEKMDTSEDDGACGDRMLIVQTP